MNRMYMLRAGLLSCCIGGAVAAAPQSQEEFARRQFESGLAFLQQGKHVEAIKDFEAVVNSYPATAIADDALLEIVRYQLEVADDLPAAQAATDTLLKKYPSSDSAPMARIMAGRISMANGRSPAEIDAAVSEFFRVSRLYPGTDAVPVAMYYAGEAMRLGKRPADSLSRFRQVAVDYPRSPWAARALLGAGRALVMLEQPLRALEDFQRVRLRFPGTVEAQTALAWNSIVYRLYVRQPVLPPYTVANRALTGTSGKLRDVRAIVIAADERVFAASRPGVLSFDRSGKSTGPFAGADPKSLFLNRRGELIVGLKGALTPGNGKSIPLGVPKPGSTPRPLEEIVASAGLSTGEYLVADLGAKTIARFSPAGKSLDVFTSVNPERIAVNAFDDVAVLPKDEKEVRIFDHTGKRIGGIPFKGTGYELREPVDIAYDALTNLYVLDRGKRAVLVFSPQAKLIATYSPAEKTPGVFREAAAFAIDPGGRILVYDQHSERIQIHQ